jgi:hypothetical protein
MTDSINTDDFKTADGVLIFDLNEVFGVVHGSEIVPHWTNYCLVSGYKYDISSKEMELEYPSVCGCCPDDIVNVPLSSCYSTEALALQQLEIFKGQKQKRDEALNPEKV